MSIVTAATWVPRGQAAQFPTKAVFDGEEYSRIAKLAKLQLDDAQAELEEAQEAEEVEEEVTGTEQANGAAKNAKSKKKSSDQKEDVDDDLKEYDLDNYDNDEEDEDGTKNVLGMFSNIKSLAYYESNDDDPYITLKDGEDSDSEREELEIMDTDNLLLAARIEDEVAHLEVYVYEDEADNLYVHHDIMLPAIPLTVEWLNYGVGREANEGGKANFVAVGTMDPEIEIWDLDVVDSMYPNAVLGQVSESATEVDKSKKKKKKKKSKKPNENHHVDAVLSLAANRQHSQLLASASADTTVKLWDLSTTQCAKSYSWHTDKVCSIAWNPKDTTGLLSGSYDRTVVLADMRAPDGEVRRWGVESDVESVRWNPHDPFFFYVSTENGVIHYHDARVAPTDISKTKPLWTLQAHDKAITTFDVNPIIPGFLVTGSADKQTKLWNIDPAAGPSMVVSRDLGVGQVFATSFAPDQEVGFRLAVAGSKGDVKVWDTSTNKAVRSVFAGRVREGIFGKEGDAEVEERFVGVEESSDEDSSDGEEAGEEGQDGWEDEDEDEEMEG
ncbi:uncharacterized protein PV09_04807 [Verruconis gallopava]|uniref:Uncharacterized protein n=1 Tax=Verruconis gallopava TaxID=253628 RepID=A0A0D2AXV5_9PEZI|nr:uncharacterized protein PV09_04807 [Verruconis gallopava]KIW03974.1 hypothetical protein PV09_04807 [Verruconis gallopava]